jgi:hypothetical protein
MYEIENRASKFHLNYKILVLKQLLPRRISSKEKDKNMQLWMQDQAQVIVATNALEWELIRPPLKTVIHIQLPDMKTITKKQEQVETMKSICCLLAVRWHTSRNQF